MSPVSTAIDALRQPEYVGENRCMPCTLVNTVIALVLAGAVWVAVAPAAGVGVLAVSAAAIGLRGYLVPGTPTLTKRYLPDRVLAWFDKAPTAAERAGDDSTDTVDVEGALLAAGVVAPCEDVDDLCLDDGFRENWRAAMVTVGEQEATPDAVASLLDVEPERLALDTMGASAYVATVDGVRAGQWESRAALVADAAAADLVADRDPRWDDRSVPARGEILGGLRLFLEACPDCGGEVRFGRETVESCCRSRDVVAVSCADCDARLFEATFDG